MSVQPVDVRTDSEGVEFDCPVCGWGLTVGLAWDDEEHDTVRCDDCGALFSVSVQHLGYDVTIRNGTGVEVGEGHY